MTGEIPCRPFISIALLTYNHERYVAQAIGSVLGQVVSRDYEIVVGEDCSTDGTRDVVEGFRNRYPDKIRVTYSPRNLGYHQTVKRLFNECRGKYIALLEGDDYWTDHSKLERQCNAIEGDGTVMCTHMTDQVDADGKVIATIPERPLKPRTKGGDFIAHGVYCHTSSLFMRAELCRILPEYVFDKRNRCMDFSIEQVVAHHGDVSFIDRHMSVYRANAEGVAATFQRNRDHFDRAMLFAMERFDRYTKGAYRDRLNYLKALRYESLAKPEQTRNGVARLFYKGTSFMLRHRMIAGRFRTAFFR